MQRFYRSPDGQWLAAWAHGDFPDDGTRKAVALATACGLEEVVVVDLPDDAPDPREGTLLAPPEAASPPPDPTPIELLQQQVTALTDEVTALKTERVTLEQRLETVETKVEALPTGDDLPIEAERG